MRKHPNPTPPQFAWHLEPGSSIIAQHQPHPCALSTHGQCCPATARSVFPAPQLPREYSILAAGPGVLNFRAQGGVAAAVHTCSQAWPPRCFSHSALLVSSLPPVSSPGISERGPWMPRASWGPDPMLSPLSHELPHSPRYPGTDCTLAGSSRTLHVPWSQQMSGSLEGPTVKRRGGVMDHRDVILAHQAHKMHSTPQARWKEWE